MKIKVIVIKNYKCHKQTIIPISSNLHTFVGPNSAGKTSIIEACKLARSVGNLVEYGGIVYGGILKGTTPRTVEIKFIVELSPEERNYHFSTYFFLSSELIEEPTATKILNRVSFTFSTQNVKGNSAEIVLTEVAISDVDDDEFIPVLAITNDGSQVTVSDFKPGIKGRINNNPYVNEHLKGLKKDTFNFNSVPKEAFQSKIAHDFLALLRFIPSFRETNKKVNSKYFEDFSSVDEEGSDLISMMVTMYLNGRDQFNEIEDICKRLFPEIETVHPEQIAKDSFTISIKKKNIPNEILLEHEGTGIDQLFIMVWLIATARPGTIWFIDEPELHLHPGAQKLFYDYLIKRTEDSQILVTSHSMVFIHKSELNQVTLLIYDENGVRNVLLADLIDAEKENSDEGLKEIQSKVYGALGYDPTFVLEPKTVVIVEGRTDMNILTSFCKALDKPIDRKKVYFLVVGDKYAARNFSPILIYALSNKRCMIILDNDKGVPQDIKQSLFSAEESYRKKIHLDQPLLSDENFFFYPQEVYSIEYYLLEPQAICRTFNITDQSIMNEITKSIDEKFEDIKRKSILPKDFLKQLCEKYSQSSYETDTEIRIANHISPNHLKKFSEIINLINLITS